MTKDKRKSTHRPEVKKFTRATMRRIRTSKGITQTRLAKRARTSQGYISFFETGRMKPTEKELKRIAKGLRCDVTDLMR